MKMFWKKKNKAIKKYYVHHPYWCLDIKVDSSKLEKDNEIIKSRLMGILNNSGILVEPSYRYIKDEKVFIGANHQTALHTGKKDKDIVCEVIDELTNFVEYAKKNNQKYIFENIEIFNWADDIQELWDYLLSCGIVKADVVLREVNTDMMQKFAYISRKMIKINLYKAYRKEFSEETEALLRGDMKAILRGNENV